MPEIPQSLRSISGTHSRGRTHHRGQPPAAQLTRPGAELAALVLSVFDGDPLRTLHGSASLTATRSARSTARRRAPGGASYYLGALNLAVSAGACHTERVGPRLGSLRWAEKGADEREERVVSESRAGWLRSRQSNVIGGRVHRHVVKLTDEQELAVQAAARVQGVTVARLLADSALKAPRASVSREDLTELFAVTKLIAALGRNVNQLAKVANATGELAPETEATLASVLRVFDRIRTLPRELTGT